MILILCQGIENGEESGRVREDIREKVGFEVDLRGQGTGSRYRRQMGRHIRRREQQGAELGVGWGIPHSQRQFCSVDARWEQ